MNERNNVIDKMDDYATLKAKVLASLRENNACEPGCQEVMKAGNIGMFSLVMKEYWLYMINQYREAAIRLFEEFYLPNREALNKHGIFYNESADRGYVFVTGGQQADVVIGGYARAWVFGSCMVEARDNASVRLREQASATLFGRSSCLAFDQTKVYAHDYSQVNASGRSLVVADGLCTVDAGEQAEVKAIKWRTIRAFGNALVTSHTDKHILISDAARFFVQPIKKIVP